MEKKRPESEIGGLVGANPTRRKKDEPKVGVEMAEATELRERLLASGRQLNLEKKLREKVEKDLSERLKFERLLLDLSARFIRISHNRIDLEIQNALWRILEFFQVDRCGLLKIEQDGTSWQVIYAASVEGLPDLPTEVDLPVDLFPWAFKKTVERRKVHTFASVEDLPPEAGIDRRTYEEWGIRSNANIPITVDGSSEYNFGLATYRRQRSWPEDYISRLRALGEIIVKSLQLVRTQRRLNERRKFENLVSDISSGFVIDGTQGLEVRIADWLRRIAELFDTDRCGLRLFSDDLSLLGNAFEYRREGFEPSPEFLSQEDLPWYMAQLSQGKAVAVGRLDDLPEEAENERRFCLARQLKSVLSVPMTNEGKIVGAFAVASVRKERTWPEEIVQRMRFVAEVFAGALARKQMEEKLRERLTEIGRLKKQLEKENIHLRKEIELRHVHKEIVGRSLAMKNILAQVEQVAQTDSTVLIEGETGAGKELLARAVHRLSVRKDRPMVTVNCASLPPSLIESELFGREKGAYTGALTRMAGRFETADKATLFLDEVGELPQEVQAKLLRVLEEGKFERLGSTKTLRVDVRIIAATNRDLAREVDEGGFRKDLYYRLNVFPIAIPPLRERPEDIPLLVWTFVRQYEKKMGKRIENIPRTNMEELMRYPWPGNARELRNVVEHSMILNSGKTLEVHPPAKTSAYAPDDQSLEEVERNHIARVLEKCGGRLSGKGGAAGILGLKRTTLQSKMKKLGIRRLPG